MVISREELLDRTSELVWNRRLVIEPFFPDSIDRTSASASLDFHLGNRFTILMGRPAAQHDPLSKEARQDVVVREFFIPRGEAFSLRPGQLILGTTLEWFKFPYDLLAYVMGRSIWGRRGLLNVTAQAVHPRSSGTITLELSNQSEVAIKLKPGVAIGHLVFHKIENADPSLQARHSNFSGAHRPILGKYTPTRVEKLLLGITNQ